MRVSNPPVARSFCHEAVPAMLAAFFKLGCCARWEGGPDLSNFNPCVDISREEGLGGFWRALDVLDIAGEQVHLILVTHLASLSTCTRPLQF